MNRVGHLPALTFVRFLAALAVVWFHFGRFVPMPSWLMNITMSGYIWVSFFFVLSGFILVYSARDLGSADARREFYVRRAARLLPGYLVAWVLFAFCQFTDPAISFSYWLKTTAIFGGLALGFIQGWIPGAAEYWNTPGWSLSCEAFFYLCFPAIFLAVCTMTRRMLWISLLVLVFGNAASVLLVAELTKSRLLVDTVFSTDWGTFLRDHPLNQILQFATGVVLGKLYVDGARLPRAGMCLVLCIGALAALLPLEYRDVRRDVLLVPLFGVLIYSLASFPRLGTGRVGATGMLLGNASYAIYILQEPIWFLYADATETPRWGGTVTIESMIFFLALLIVSCVVFYQQFEKRAEPILRRALNSPTLRLGASRRSPSKLGSAPSAE